MSGVEEAVAFPLDIAEKARMIFLLCLVRASTQSAAATQRSAEEIDVISDRRRQMVPHISSPSSFRALLSQATANRADPLAWHRQLLGRDGYILIRYLQGTSRVMIGREVGLTHTAIKKVLDRLEASDLLPPLISFDPSSLPAADLALMVIAWRYAALAMVFHGPSDVARCLSFLLGQAAKGLTPSRHRAYDYGDWLVSFAARGEPRPRPILWQTMHPSRIYQIAEAWRSPLTDLSWAHNYLSQSRNH